MFNKFDPLCEKEYLRTRFKKKVITFRNHKLKNSQLLQKMSF